MRFTYRAAGPVAAAAVLTLLCGCSRAQQDWRAAQQAGTPQAYRVFAARHPDSELAGVARQRIAQLTEEAAWQQATRANTPAAYRQYLAKYPNGSWSQDARIRMESRSLVAQALPDAGPVAASGPVASDPVAAPPVASRPVMSGGTQPVQAPDWPGAAASPPGPQAAKSNAVGGAVRTRFAAIASPSVGVGSTHTGRFAVQLGAFSNSANADAAWTQLSSKFGRALRGLTPQIVPVVSSSGRRLYRLEARVASQAAARGLCRQLQQHSQGCLPVP